MRNIQSVFSYLMVIWPNTTTFNLNRLQRLQNKALKCLLGLPYEYSTTKIYDTYPFMKLDQLIKFQQCKLVYRIENKQIKSQHLLKKVHDITNRETRQKNSYYFETTKSEFQRKSPIYSRVHAFNNLPNHVKKCIKCNFNNYKK